MALPLLRVSDTFCSMTEDQTMYERPRLERYGTFRELTKVSLNLGAFALNQNVVGGTAASCDCLPDDGNKPNPTRS
jgi:hypothetical protein